MSTPGSLFVITAASGTGKTSLVSKLIQDIDDLSVSISHTTRDPRPGEVNGEHYHFTDKKSFLSDVMAGAFIEHAEVFGNFYGTQQQTVEDMLAAGTDVILEIDWQGAQQVKRLFDQVTMIFIIPPSRDALRERLSNRGQDSDEVIEQRLSGSLQEMRQYVNFDYLVVNDDFDTALSELKAIIISHRVALDKQQHKQLELLQRLLA